MSVPSPSDPAIQELMPLDASVAGLLKDRDSASRHLADHRNRRALTCYRQRTKDANGALF